MFKSHLKLLLHSEINLMSKAYNDYSIINLKNVQSAPEKRIPSRCRLHLKLLGEIKEPFVFHVLAVDTGGSVIF